MGRMLQVRNLPDEVHARLKERAAAERMSLSDYVARELERLVQYRSNAEILAAARERRLTDGHLMTRAEILEARDAARAEQDGETRDVGTRP
ncbi:plasmid stability protein [Microbacterium sp. W4I4]|uniref:FitA-like ribbon-helix-helix domain-containing protein n=1 Tax=Microbacterium sp. W4I4 TaxID=3042295 RepID=UPI00277E7A27|nr:antitoxin [Microbacterium sp. W4I4]MDQ0613557.1 plasmid stability protein [Microbacterium sp. W4I4]